MVAMSRLTYKLKRESEKLHHLHLFWAIAFGWRLHGYICLRLVQAKGNAPYQVEANIRVLQRAALGILFWFELFKQALGLMSTNRSHNQGNNLYEFFGISCIFSLIIFFFFVFPSLFVNLNRQILESWPYDFLSLSIYIYIEREIFAKDLNFSNEKGII